MSDRLAGLVVTVAALAFFAGAAQLQTPLFADPLGPKAFPMLVSGAGLLAGVVMLIKPDPEPDWPVWRTFARLAAALGILILYAFSLTPLGFLVPTAAASAAVSYLIKPRIGPSILTGVLLSAGLFAVFKFALGLSLFAFPRGWW